MDPETAEVKAAGGVVWRRGAATASSRGHPPPPLRRLVAAQGQARPGRVAGRRPPLREVEEEIGVRGALGAELPPTYYQDRKGRAKVVRYWLMEAEARRRSRPTTRSTSCAG